MYALHMKRLRARKGWTQADLARKAGVSLQTVQKMEQDRVPVQEPPVIRMIRLGMQLEGVTCRPDTGEKDVL